MCGRLQKSASYSALRPIRLKCKEQLPQHPSLSSHCQCSLYPHIDAAHCSAITYGQRSESFVVEVRHGRPLQILVRMLSARPGLSCATTLGICRTVMGTTVRETASALRSVSSPTVSLPQR